MPFFLPKSTTLRVANTLQKHLHEHMQSAWANYVDAVQKYHPDELPIPVENGDKDPFKIARTFSWHRAKEDFSWGFHLKVPHKKHFVVENTAQQYIYYASSFSLSQQITNELNKQSPDYKKVHGWIDELKNSDTILPSVIEGREIPFNLNNSWRGNFFMEFISSVAAMVYAPVLMVVGLLFTPSYLLSYSQYCGGPEFFIDTINYSCDSAVQLIAIILFPLELLHAKYTTDSFNVWKGSMERSLNSLDNLLQDSWMVASFAPDSPSESSECKA